MECRGGGAGDRIQRSGFAALGAGAQGRAVLILGFLQLARQHPGLVHPDPPPPVHSYSHVYLNCPPPLYTPILRCTLTGSTTSRTGASPGSCGGADNAVLPTGQTSAKPCAARFGRPAPCVTTRGVPTRCACAHCPSRTGGSTLTAARWTIPWGASLGARPSSTQVELALTAK